jgi:hypothetical protein
MAEVGDGSGKQKLEGKRDKKKEMEVQRRNKSLKGNGKVSGREVKVED